MKKKKPTQVPNKEKILQTFVVTIKDPYHSCSYSFRLSKDISFVDIAKAIAKKFKVETPYGKFSEGEGIEL
jgi:hypothetical protein